MRYEAIGAGIYELDPTAAPGDPDERERVAFVVPKYHANMSVEEQAAFATRIAAALNGNEALVDALKGVLAVIENNPALDAVFVLAHVHGHQYDGPEFKPAEIRAALSAAEPAEVVG